MSTPPTSETEQPPAAQGVGDAASPAAPSHRAPRPVPGATVEMPTGHREASAAGSDVSPTRSDIAATDWPGQPTVALPVGSTPRAAEPAPEATPEEGAAGIFPESVVEEPGSRAAAHWWGVLIALTLSPIAWFLLSDGGARIYWSLSEDPAAINVAGVLGLAGGLAVAAIVLVAARWSSVGPIIAGSITALGGLAFLVVPERTIPWLEAQQATFDRLGGFGSNLHLYLMESGMRGHLLVAGVVLVLVGVVSHGARRQGRREARARLAARAAAGEDPFG